MSIPGVDHHASLDSPVGAWSLDCTQNMKFIVATVFSP